MILFSTNAIAPLLFVGGLLISQAWALERSENHERHMSTMSLASFKELLLTEVHDEMDHLRRQLSDVDPRRSHQSPRKLLSKQHDLLKVQEEERLWKEMVDHGWFMSKKLSRNESGNTESKNLRRRNDKKMRDLEEDASSGIHNTEAKMCPFLVCNRSQTLNTGSQRANHMVEHKKVPRDTLTIVSNDDSQTCFYINSNSEEIQALFLNSEDKDEYSVVPMADLMKISRNTISEVSREYWPVPDLSQLNNVTDWERTVRIAFSPGNEALTTEEALLKARNIISDIKAMGEEGSKRRKRKLSQKDSVSVHEGTLSVSEAFSITSSMSKATVGQSQPNLRRVEEQDQPVGRAAVLARSLQDGIEADHSCRLMFDRLDLRAEDSDRGFEIILNPTGSEELQRTGEEVKSSASNVNCIISLIVAASTHPEVLTVEAETPIAPDDFESQWITQSDTNGNRAFFDKDLTGAGQIVSVVDSGLDMNHPLFQQASTDVKGNWDRSQRKVLKYDHAHNGGDYEESLNGHGTKVASIVAGCMRDGNDNEADGIAIDAKLHVLDIQKSGQAYTAPGIRKMISLSSHPDGGANIINISWDSRYKGYYSGTCRNYDNELYKNPDILVVASAGNRGVGAGGQATIGDPASCKNTLAVGASESANDRILRNDKGRNYMASFSSRGPTPDSRMKPDIVAPGYNLITAVAKTSGYTQVFGTSFAAPVVSGSAAIVRQYFEDGFYPGGKRNSGESMKPSGSLVKAVMGNSAHPLRGIQNVPEGTFNDNISEFDNNQGMGAVNLLSTLPIAGRNEISMLVKNNRMIKDRKRTNFFVQAKEATELSTTLAWYDAPGEVNCAQCLINDLDLWVTEVDNQGRAVRGPRYYSNGLGRRDSRNTVEKVRMNMKKGHRYRITVSATNLADDSAYYSLIAAGNFEVQKRKIS